MRRMVGSVFKRIRSTEVGRTETVVVAIAALLLMCWLLSWRDWQIVP